MSSLNHSRQLSLIGAKARGPEKESFPTGLLARTTTNQACSMKHTAAYDLLAYNNTADLAPRKPSPVSPHSFPEDLKCLPRDDVVLVAGGSSRGRSKLS